MCFPAFWICCTCFFYKQYQTKIGKKNQTLLLENYLFFSFFCFLLISKNNRVYSKKFAKNKCVYFNEIIWLIMIKVKKKNRSHRYVINRSTSRHGLTYTKYKKCLGMMMLISIKQHSANTWGLIHEKVKEHWGWVEKKVLLIKNKKCHKCQKSEMFLNQKLPITKRPSY